MEAKIGSIAGRKEFSRIGFALFLMLIVDYAARFGLAALFGNPLSGAGEKSWAWFAVSVLPL